MGLHIGAGEAANVYLGAEQVTGIYVGDTMVWSPIASQVIADPGAGSLGSARSTGYNYTRTASGPLTVSAGRDRTIVLWLAMSHTNWLNTLGTGGYNNGLAASSHLDGPFTMRASTFMGSSGQRMGSLSLWTLDDPTPGLHTITGGVSGSDGQLDAAMWVAQSFRHVASVTASPLTTEGATGALDHTLAAGGAGDLAFIG